MWTYPKKNNAIFSALVFFFYRKQIAYISQKKTEKYSTVLEEYKLLKMIDHQNVIKPIELNTEFGLVIEHFDGKKLYKVDIHGIDNKYEWLQELESLIDYLRKKNIYSKIDIHDSNLLLKIANNKIIDWKLIDFEIFQPGDAFRNDDFIKSLRKKINGR